jgi:nucleotide-binding universal stress UspA family protein
VPPKSVLAALDGSEAARSALRHAIDLARAEGAGVSGLFVKDSVVLDAYLLGDLPGMMGVEPVTSLKSDVERFLEAGGKSLLAEAQKECAAAKVPFSGKLVSGRVSAEIAKAAESAELVAMGIWGAGAEGPGVGGHLTALLGALSKPVLASPGTYRKITKAVVAYDDSEPARRALKLATSLAKAAGWPLEAVVVSDDPSADRFLDSAKKAAPSAKLTRLKGDPRSVLLKLAGKKEGTLLAMGTHGHGFVHSMVLGSTTRHVLQGAEIPILFAR